MKKRTTVILFLLLGVPSLSLCQTVNPIHWSAHVSRPDRFYHPGQKLIVVMKADIDAGWHLYSFPQPPESRVFPAFIMVPKGQAFVLAGEIERPAAESAMDPNFGVETSFYENSVAFRIPLRVVANLHPGKQKLTLQVRYQTCNDRMCLPPKTETIETPIEIGEERAQKTGTESRDNTTLPTGPAGTTAPPSSAPNALKALRPGVQETLQTTPTTRANPVSPASFQAQGRTSLLGFLWLAMGFGALSLLTPCVFPMIPITVSYFTNHAGESRKSAALTALVYAVGIVLTFTALGMLLAALFGAAGVNQLAANPWVNLFITALFLAFAFSLFGVFFIQVPPSLMTKLGAITRSKEGSGVIGALLMGATFTLTSFTCTAPFVGTLLVMTSQGNWQWPLAGMFAFSTVFAIPFFVLALAPQLLARLPKAGGWMVQLKVVMGLLEIAAAMKFLSNADLVWRWGFFTRQVVLAVWVGIGALTVLCVLGHLRMDHDTPVPSVGPTRATIAIVFLATTIWLIPGLFGRPLGELESFLPPEVGSSSNSASAASSQKESGWILNNYEGALATAKQQNRLVFVDFTGYTCTNCRWMEANMFPRPKIANLLGSFVCTRLYTDGDGDVFARQQNMQQEKFGTVALPYYAILRPNGKSIATFPGLTRDENQFVSFLQKGQSNTDK